MSFKYIFTAKVCRLLINEKEEKLDWTPLMEDGILGATKHLYNWLCPLVGRSVGWSVGNAFVRRSTRRTLLAYLALLPQFSLSKNEISALSLILGQEARISALQLRFFCIEAKISVQSDVSLDS